MYVKQKPFWADFYMPQVEEKVKPAAKNFKFRQQDARTFHTTAINKISICWVNCDAFSVIFFQIVCRS